MKNILLFFAILVSIARSKENILYRKPFPEDFMLGISTSTYQIEGAWNVDGKAESMWDRYTHTHSQVIADGSNGVIACDSYNKIEEDVNLLKNLGVDHYRFSISWGRILPNPFSDKVNELGIRHYNKLINLLVENGIQPVVTIYHWDLPQSLLELGGFTNPLIIEYYIKYAKVLFQHFGDRVKWWTTFNEPIAVCMGYGTDIILPLYNNSGIGEYLCSHNLLKAHAEAYHLYDEEFRTKQKGNVSIALSSPWFEPATKSEEDIKAAERAAQFYMGWFANPIYSETGDYPGQMKECIGKRSKEEDFKKSRLPKFTTEEIKRIRGTFDFFGFNHYTAYLTANIKSIPIGIPSYINDLRVNYYHDPSWPAAADPKNAVVSWGFTNILLWIKKRYGNQKVLVLENGYSDFGGLNDTERINYIYVYMTAMQDAMDRGAELIGYTLWNLLDGFEWMAGYKYKYGLYHVDFSSPNRTRTPKASANYYKNVIATRILSP